MARIINYGSSFTEWKPKSSRGPAPVAAAAAPAVTAERRQEIMEREAVWVADPSGSDGFLLGQIVDLDDAGASVKPLGGDGRKAIITAAFDRIFPAEENDTKDVDDNCGLMYLNEATLLNNVRLRYDKEKIYTYVANILIAINPYCDIRNLYDAKSIKAYQGRSLGTMPPHVFAIADKAFRDMKVLKQSQSIIVSGESGAGKTESTKYILKYLCDSYGTTAGSLEQKILNANPILEAFGNAKTTRNNNSSRFGKFIEIHFDSRCQVAGGYISHYLLERARVVSQSAKERNYHIFYQLCAGAPEGLRQKLRLAAPDQFRYLNNGCTRYFLTKDNDRNMAAERKSCDQRTCGPLSDPMLDDARYFDTLDGNLRKLGMTDADVFSVYATIAIVLHLGNVSFEDDPDDNRGGCRVTDGTESSLKLVAGLMGVDADELRRALTARVMQATKGGYKGTVIMVPLKVHEASSARDALAKSIYSRLFDYIVIRINQSIPFGQKSSYFIGVLDIAGFEYFTVNSFEQFCINYCNEKLQQFFNQRILKDEQELYEKEGLGVKKIDFVDNQDCIDLIESKQNGIFGLLDEESKLPKPSPQHFTTAVQEHNGCHFRLALPRKSKLREHREIRDDDGFLIRHFAGAVCYQTAQFIEKNNDALHASLEALAHEARNPFILKIFSNSQEASVQKGKLSFISVASKFKSQLSELMEKLRATGTNFIRCIKPNVKMVSHLFEGGAILSQLQCAGMTSVLELMQQGYPSRTAFAELYTMYKKFLPPELARLDPRLFCKALFKALGLDDNDFKFGMTKVFFRPGKFAEFDQMLKSDPENLRVLVSRVKRWLLCSHWRKAQWCALSVIKLRNKILYRRSCLITAQKTVRMFLARKKHAPRYKGVARLRTLQSQIEEIGRMSGSLKKDKDSIRKNAGKIHDELAVCIAKIKSRPDIGSQEIDSMYKTLVDFINKELASVKSKIEKQKIAEEQERVRALQAQMEEERRRKEEEDRGRRELEEERQVRAEMEERRKREEEAAERQLLVDSAAALRLQEELTRENARLQQQIEQERRDHELALRLAHESNSTVDPEPLTTPQLALKRSEMVTQQRQRRAGNKYDLSKWKYAELRDTINTSCDIELLEACREEFHRRLKVYHAWKAKNKKKNSTFDENMRAPSSILQEASRAQVVAAAAEQYKQSVSNGGNGTATAAAAAAAAAQRFFRIPFVRPEDPAAANSSLNGGAAADAAHQTAKGWWYAHFDGDWIGRQMELHPERGPVLLVAGADDMQMCELSLAETGLPRKRGAEILEHEFEREWAANGGRDYARPAQRKASRR